MVARKYSQWFYIVMRTLLNSYQLRLICLYLYHIQLQWEWCKIINETTKNNRMYSAHTERETDVANWRHISHYFDFRLKKRRGKKWNLVQNLVEVMIKTLFHTNNFRFLNESLFFSNSNRFVRHIVCGCIVNKYSETEMVRTKFKSFSLAKYLFPDQTDLIDIKFW